jgi:ABC-type multidrug transport system fused ATPase/permease subunit
MTEAAGSGPRLRLAWPLLAVYFRAHWRTLIGGGLLGFTSGLAGLAQPLAARSVIDALGAGRAAPGPLVLLVVLVLGGGAIGTAGRFVLDRTAERVVLAARRRLISRILRLRVGVVDRLKPGDLLARVTSDTTLLRAAGTHGLVNSVNAVFILIGAVVLMGMMDLVLLGVTLGVMVVVAALAALVVPRIGWANQQAQAAVGEMSAVLERVLGAFRTVKASGAEEREAATVDAAARQAYGRGVSVAGWTALSAMSAFLAIQLSFLVVLGVGGARVAGGDLRVSSLVAFLLYLFYMMGPIGNLVEGATQLQAGIAAVSRMREVDEQPVEESATAVLPLGPPAEPAPAAVSFDNVCFRYGDRGPWVHDHVTFSVPPGSVTALVGPSGAGKTTVFSLLERFYEPAEGTVAVDGRDVRDWPLGALRAAIGYVEQDAPVLAGTLRDNLRFAAPGAGDAEIRAVVERTRLDGLLRLPDGLDTRVGHRGVTLSGGERQRVVIARALLRGPRLLLLDEATSQLDAVNELALRDVIVAAARTTTVLVIAHRLSTVASADQIVVMDSGRVRAIGTHAELLSGDSLYRELAAIQLLTAES